MPFGRTSNTNHSTQSSFNLVGAKECGGDVLYSSELQLTILQSKSHTKRVLTDDRKDVGDDSGGGASSLLETASLTSAMGVVRRKRKRFSKAEKNLPFRQTPWLMSMMLRGVPSIIAQPFYNTSTHKELTLMR